MEFYRTGHDIWGRTVLEGVSWKLIWPAIVIGAAVIVAHALWRMFHRGSGE